MYCQLPKLIIFELVICFKGLIRSPECNYRLSTELSRYTIKIERLTIISTTIGRLRVYLQKSDFTSRLWGLGSSHIWEMHEFNAYLTTRDVSKRRTNVVMQRFVTIYSFRSSVHTVWWLGTGQSSITRNIIDASIIVSIFVIRLRT